MTEKEKSRKKRSLSSFTILLIILIALALVTVAMSLAGVEGVPGATVMRRGAPIAWRAAQSAFLIQTCSTCSSISTGPYDRYPERS